jgi:hypothetical protein
MWAIKLPSELSGDEAQEKLAQIAAEHGVPPPPKPPSFFSASRFRSLVAWLLCRQWLLTRLGCVDSVVCWGGWPT